MSKKGLHKKLGITISALVRIRESGLIRITTLDHLPAVCCKWCNENSEESSHHSKGCPVGIALNTLSELRKIDKEPSDAPSTKS